MRAAAAAILLAAAWTACARAAHPLITEDAATQGAGNFQLELNSELAKDRESGVKTTARQLGALLAVGVTGSLDIMIGLPRMRIATTSNEESTHVSGAGDVSADFKWQFYKKGRASFALKPGFTIPTGDEARGLGTGRATYGAFVVGSFESEPWTVHVHTGYKANRNRVAQAVDAVHLSAAAVYQLSSRIKLAADLALDTDFRLSSAGRPAWLVLAAICALTDRVDLDFGLKRGLNAVASDTTVLLGVTARW